MKYEELINYINASNLTEAHPSYRDNEPKVYLYSDDDITIKELQQIKDEIGEAADWCKLEINTDTRRVICYPCWDEKLDGREYADDVPDDYEDTYTYTTIGLVVDLTKADDYEDLCIKQELYWEAYEASGERRHTLL